MTEPAGDDRESARHSEFDIDSLAEMPISNRWPALAAAVTVVAVGALVVWMLGGTDGELASTDVTASTEHRDTFERPAEERRYFAAGTIVHETGRVPRLCLGTAAQTSPPACDGLHVTNWEWTGLQSEQTETGRWGDYAVIGIYDRAEQSFTLTEPAREATEADYRYEEPQDFSTPCPAPEGGWPLSNEGEISDGADLVTSYRSTDGATRSSRPEDAIEGYAGASLGLNPNVLNVYVVGDLDAAEHTIRTFYDGPLCLVPARRTFGELLRTEREIERTWKVTHDTSPGSSSERLRAVYAPSRTNQVVVVLNSLNQRLERQLIERYGDAVDVQIPGLIPLKPGEIPDPAAPPPTTIAVPQAPYPAATPPSPPGRVVTSSSLGAGPNGSGGAATTDG